MFEQKFSLPAGIVTDSVKSNLSREGFLVITADRETSDTSRALYTKLDKDADTRYLHSF